MYGLYWLEHDSVFSITVSQQDNHYFYLKEVL